MRRPKTPLKAVEPHGPLSCCLNRLSVAFNKYYKRLVCIKSAQNIPADCNFAARVRDLIGRFGRLGLGLQQRVRKMKHPEAMIIDEEINKFQFAVRGAAV